MVFCKVRQQKYRAKFFNHPLGPWSCIIHFVDRRCFYWAHIRQRLKNGTHWKIKVAPHEIARKEEEVNATSSRQHHLHSCTALTLQRERFNHQCSKYFASWLHSVSKDSTMDSKNEFFVWAVDRIGMRIRQIRRCWRSSTHYDVLQRRRERIKIYTLQHSY